MAIVLLYVHVILWLSNFYSGNPEYEFFLCTILCDWIPQHILRYGIFTRLYVLIVFLLRFYNVCTKYVLRSYHDDPFILAMLHRTVN